MFGSTFYLPLQRNSATPFCIQIEEASYNSGLVASKKMINSDSESHVTDFGNLKQTFPHVCTDLYNNALVIIQVFHEEGLM